MSNITLTIPNDDHIALRAFGKALEEMALAHGAEPRKTTVDELSYKLSIDTTEATAALERLRTTAEEFQPEIDTTAQQVESLGVSVEANGATYETDLGSDNPQPAPVADSTGTPWDERIHSTSKALNADGTWRLRRKPKDMDELEWSDYVSMIKADIQYPVESGGEGEEIGEPTREEVDELIEASNKMLEPPVTPPRDDFHTDANVVTEQTVVGIPPLPVPPPVVVAPPVPEFDDSVPFPPSGTVSPTLERMVDHTTWDFPHLMTFLTERHGKIDVATVNTLLAQDGMSSVQELNAHPDKIGPFVARVKAYLGE
jgi:hypothetical protein